MGLYPLKFNPIMKDRLWGGEKLKSLFNKPSETDTTGESWELSAVKGDVSIVSNGAIKGTSLQELIDEQGEALLGKSVVNRFGREFPILIKFIDAKQDLSIQLHPNDALAKERHDSFGKTEMWYIMDADPGAKLIVGFNKDVEKEAYKKSLEDDTLLDLLNYEEVTSGDTFFINTGKIHAIGAGVLLAEIQQTSDITYRVFDFNRKDKEGNLRELHTDLALDAIDYTKKDDFKVAYNTTKDQVNGMVDCPYFKTNFLDLEKDLSQDVTTRDSFTIYMCVEGSATVTNDYGSAELTKGETILVPASSTKIAIATSGVKLLEVTI
ncbi:type I phosphomannose isomerase catalytic subunit [Croceivirga sp. JEA036]|uniref:type I phosphomannose isomerase catalytic subunit n=1 Tax=Croceivirga sp. JEA036 TaxID=2721162 RepID=UPI00143C4207|nr:type I phosphomannose isomerase catalytic subunit [Croceivirga sp. JEA036]NJB38083.1 mannose-6-phosphate isomerase [Croceivirga sp. JEA036]